MRHITHLGGKRMVFKSKEAYEDYMANVVAGVTRERSRVVKSTVTRKTCLVPPSVHQVRDFDFYTRLDAPPTVLPSSTSWTFSLVHPSRGRPQQFMECAALWKRRMSPHNKLEYILSLDHDDCRGYFETVIAMAGKLNLSLVIGPNKTMVEALNRGAQSAVGDVLIYVSDDFECPMNWDIEIQKSVAAASRADWVLFVYDGHQREIQTISIMSKAYYQAMGYMYYPEYISMFADPDFTQTAIRRGCRIDGMHLTFKHNHYTFGLRPVDATYQRQNSGRAWTWGEALYKKRQSENFGVSA